MARRSPWFWFWLAVQVGVIAFVLAWVYVHDGTWQDYAIALFSGVVYAYVLTLGHSMINDWIVSLWRLLSGRRP